MKIVLYLMNIKGLNVLKALCESDNSEMIKAVVSSRDANVKNDYYDEISTYCKLHHLIFLDRKDLDGEFDEEYRLAVGWRWMIPSQEKLIVFHDSLLPKYRGFAPLVNALIKGEHQIGVTALFASHQFDQGDVIAQKHLKITYPITISEGISKVSFLYQGLVLDVIEMIKKEKLIGVPQNNLDATYSIWRDEEDYHIDWNDSAEEISRFIDAVGYPYQGAFSLMGDQKVKVLESEVYDDLSLEMQHVGKVMLVDDGMPVIITGKGLLKIKKLLDSEDHDLLPLKQFRIRFK